MAYVDELLGRGEEKVLEARQHWIVIVGDVIKYGVTAGFLLGGLLWLSQHLPRELRAIPPALLALLSFVVVLLPLLLLFQSFLRWRSKEYVLTTWRVLDIEGMFQKSVIDSSLDKINDIVMVQSMLGRLLNYGDLEVLTGSDIGVNIFRKIADPVGFKTELVDRREALRRSYESGPSVPVGTRPQPQDMKQVLEQLYHLRQQGLLTEAEYQQKKSELLSRI